MTYGDWPVFEIDHINRIPLDNRISNLRVADIYMQRHNRLKPSRRSKTQILGVSKQDEKFVAVIRARGKAHYLGKFDSANAAAKAYLDAKRTLHPAFSGVGHG